LIVDSSALLAIILDEPERDAFVLAALAEDVVEMSTASDVECALRLDGQLRQGQDARLDAAIAHLGIALVAVSEPQARLARRAFEMFGKGRHPAALNFGDCLSYALAKATGRRLLYKGNDFIKTDLG
jgi:ribonuclease VapC